MGGTEFEFSRTNSNSYIPKSFITKELKPKVSLLFHLSKKIHLHLWNANTFPFRNGCASRVDKEILKTLLEQIESSKVSCSQELPRDKFGYNSNDDFGFNCNGSL